MTYNLSLPVRRSSVMTERTSTKLKPTPHLISPEKFKKGIFIIKILLVNFNDVYGWHHILLIERNNALGVVGGNRRRSGALGVVR